MSPTLRTGARLVGAGAILGVLVWRLGTGPFVDGLRRVDGWALVAAVALTAAATVCSAWRWSVVARGLGVEVSMRDAVPAYYRSQLLNTTLPGGVVGDVHRGVSHGRDAGDVGRGVRAVAWERTAGQVVQAVLTLIVLLALPSPVRPLVPALALGLIVLLVTAVLWSRTHPRAGMSQLARVVRATQSDLRRAVLARRRWPGVALASTVVVAAHTTAFLVAARTAGSTAPLLRLLPLALLVLVATTVPTSLGGWGPREGAAAWVFATAGLGAAQGVATAVVYGVMVTVAALPGVAVVVRDAARRSETTGRTRQVGAQG